MQECDRLLPELTLPGLHESLIERVLQLPDVGSETARSRHRMRFGSLVGPTGGARL